MEAAQFAYNLLLNTAGLAAIPFVRSRAKHDPAFFGGRLGCYGRWFSCTDGTASRLSPSIWFHAASVGEVTGAVPTLIALRQQLPGARISLTSSTPQGLRIARKNLETSIHVLPYPLDYPWAVDRALDFLQPDLYVALESEFWPNVFRALDRRSIPTILLNGRISARSARRYLTLKPLFQPIFQQFKKLAMLSKEDVRHALALGAYAERTEVLPSSKADGLVMKASPEKASEWRHILNIPEDAPVIIGGSLRRSECTLLLDVFHGLERLPQGALGIFAPRHMDRIPNMLQWLEARRISYDLLTRLQREPGTRCSSVIIVDCIGALFDLYSVGDLIFCGGTLEPIGGHNILEPAAWGRPVFYGPYLQKVFQEHTILKTLGGGFPVADAADLLRQWTHWIHRIPDLDHHGRMARQALDRLGGSTARQMEIILETLQDHGKLASNKPC